MNTVNSPPPKYLVLPTATGTAEILQQSLAQNQEMMQLLYANSGESFRNNTNRPPTNFTGSRQGQPRHPVPDYFDKYCWAHGCGSHKRLNGNSKAPGHKYKAATEIKIYRSNDGCTQLWCGRVPMVATNDNRNILLNSTDSTPIPHKFNSYKHELLSNSTKRINLKSDKGAMRNYI